MASPLAGARAETVGYALTAMPSLTRADVLWRVPWRELQIMLAIGSHHQYVREWRADRRVTDQADFDPPPLPEWPAKAGGPAVPPPPPPESADEQPRTPEGFYINPRRHMTQREAQAALRMARLKARPFPADAGGSF